MDPTPHSNKDRAALRFAMNLSLGVGIFMFGLKIAAYLLTGSSAILSDAAESIVHVVAVAFAAYSLRLSERPPDSNHLFGHAKISYFSAGFEGAMIIVAALFILVSSIQKWMHGLELENLGFGTLLTALSVAINAALGAYLLWIGKQKSSLILSANGKHVLTDVWTSFGVVIGLSLTLITHWLPWDPICAILVAINILVSGYTLIRQAIAGLMDIADPKIDATIRTLLDKEHAARGIEYHGLRHRNLGDGLSVEVHLLFPGHISLQEAHANATQIEETIQDALPLRAEIVTHLESIEDHALIHKKGEPANQLPGTPEI